mgnify:CR=1 FL=1
MRNLTNLTNKQHPFKNFTTGNLETLSNDVQLYDKMRQMFDEFYCLSNMTLVIYHNKNLYNTEWLQCLLSKIKPFPVISKKHEKLFYNQLCEFNNKINTFPIENANRLLFAHRKNEHVIPLINHKVTTEVLMLKPLLIQLFFSLQ